MMRCQREFNAVTIQDRRGGVVVLEGEDILGLAQWVSEWLMICGGCGEWTAPEDLQAVTWQQVEVPGGLQTALLCPLCMDEYQARRVRQEVQLNRRQRRALRHGRSVG